MRRRGRLGLSFEITYPSDATLRKLMEHHLPPGADVADTIRQMRGIETRLGLPAPTAALTDIFAKAGLRAVDEVLSEVVSTNKKVFKTIDELLSFLGLSDAWTKGERAANGLAWERIDGDAPPTATVYG